MIFQEYVECPRQIQFSQTLKAANQALEEEQGSPDNTLQVGTFYCVITESEEGYEIVECDIVTEEGFVGVCLVKCSGKIFK